MPKQPKDPFVVAVFDSAGSRISKPMPLLVDGDLDEAQDVRNQLARQHADQGAELLRLCPTHPDVPLVDCLTCDAAPEGTP